jgi:hypothetical protein
MFDPFRQTAELGQWPVFPFARSHWGKSLLFVQSIVPPLSSDQRERAVRKSIFDLLRK